MYTHHKAKRPPCSILNMTFTRNRCLQVLLRLIGGGGGVKETLKSLPLKPRLNTRTLIFLFSVLLTLQMNSYEFDRQALHQTHEATRCCHKLINRSWVWGTCGPSGAPQVSAGSGLGRGRKNSHKQSSGVERFHRRITWQLWNKHMFMAKITVFKKALLSICFIKDLVC